MDLQSATMDQLISRVLRGEASQVEEAQVLHWRRASQDNERYFREFARLLTEAEAAAWEQLPPETPPMDALLRRRPGIRARVAAGRMVRGRARRGLTFGGLTLAVAALATLVVGTLSKPAVGPDAGTLLLASGEIVTRTGETATVTLGDGSIVRLAPESRLRITQRPGVREVWLEGRAFFAVVEQPQTPFRVRTHSGDALVLGTRFDLQVRQDNLRLLVVEGAVNLDAHGAAVDLTASELGLVNGSSPPSREVVDAAFMANERRWMGNFLVFENTPLAQAAAELSSHYGVPVEVLDGELATETVRGVFAGEELEDVVRVLCRVVSAYCSVKPSGVTIGP